jgi:hypothetical protein
MVSDSFFSTAAQVLPALLIALVIEFSYLTDLATRRQLRPFERAFLARRLLGQTRRAAADASTDASKQFERWQSSFLNFGTVFILGESLSLATLMFDTTPAWLSWVIGIITFGCVAILTRAVVFVPLVKFNVIRVDQLISGRPATPDGK